MTEFFYALLVIVLVKPNSALSGPHHSWAPGPPPAKSGTRFGYIILQTLARTERHKHVLKFIGKFVI